MNKRAWEYQKKAIDQGFRYTINQNNSPLSYPNALRLWKESEAFRQYFIDLLLDNSFTAFKWETPPITNSTLERNFEFVVINAPYLDVEPDSSDFADHFRLYENESVINFQNLGGDAEMVAPCEIDLNANYSHLAAFTRTALIEQQHKLWQRVAELALQHTGNQPRWLSTAGGGVPWLHVRLDSRPKYYGYQPYTKAK